MTNLTPRAYLVSSPDQRVHPAFLHYTKFSMDPGLQWMAAWVGTMKQRRSYFPI